MIVIDIFANMFDWDDVDHERAKRVSDAGMAALQKGAPAVYLEALLAVLDAASAYCRNMQSKEATKRLEIEFDTLREQLAELDQRLRIERTIASHQFEAQLQALRLRLERQAFDVEIGASTFDKLTRQTRQIGSLISDQGKIAPLNCPKLATLEDAYYQLVDKQLLTAQSMVEE